MNVNTITLDVSKEPAHEPTLYLGQGDKNGTTLVVNMFDNGEVLDLTGMTVTFCMRTPGGTDYYQVVGAVDDGIVNKCSFTIDETYAAGHVGTTDIAYIKVDDGATTITSTSRVRVVVLPSATEAVEPAPAYKTLIDQFIADAQEDIDEAVAAAEAIVDYNVPLMSANTRGGAKLGSSFGIDPTSEKLALNAATQLRIGGFKVGDGVQMDAYDCLNLKKASTSTLGGVKVDGTTITADSDGTIHGANTYTLPPATTSTLGGVIPDGTTITVDNDGTIHGASGSTSASDIDSGTLAVAYGGTGKNSAAGARAYLGSIPLALSSTGASTAAKTATLDGFELFDGARVLVNFSNANTLEGALTLNINNTGAKNVWAGGNLTSSSNPVTWSADATCEFVYFGNSWAYLGNDTDGYEDYQAGQAISDLAAAVGNVDVATDGDLQSQVDTLRDSVVHYADIIFENVAITSRSNAGAYYRASMPVPSLSDKTIIGATLNSSWEGFPGNISCYISIDGKSIGFISDTSITCTKIGLRVLYI